MRFRFSQHRREGTLKLKTMEFGILSLTDLQSNPGTGVPFPALQRIDEIIGYAALADRLGLEL